MRITTLLFLPSICFSAPVPKPNEKVTIELKLAAKNQDVLHITIENNGMTPFKLPYRSATLESFTVELRGDNGKTYTIKNIGGGEDDIPEMGTLTIPAGESATLTLHTCHYLLKLGEERQKITFLVRLKYAGTTIESDRLTVEP